MAENKRFTNVEVNETGVNGEYRICMYENGEYIRYSEKGLETAMNRLSDENEQLKKEVEMLRNGLKAYDEALPLYLGCEDIMHFKNSELFEFEMERMNFYKKYPNRVHYK